MKRINLLFVILIFAGWANATTYLVQPGGSGAAWSGVTGTLVDLTVQNKTLNAWYTAATITAADQIWIIKGTYTLTGYINTKSTEKIYGGFAGTEQTVGDRAKGTNAWDFTNETIISGNNAVRGIVSTTGATIDGLTIMNCAYSVASGTEGAGVKITTSSILQNCIVRNNTITGTGALSGQFAGGVCVSTNGKLYNSYIHHNSNTNLGTAVNGNGGGVVINGLGIVDGCTISNNTTARAGGGIYIMGNAGGTIVNMCTISNNVCNAQSGGGVNVLTNTIAFTTGTSLTISNCTLSGNTARANGGGLAMDNSATYITNVTNILNCTVSSNISSDGLSANFGNGGGIILSNGKYFVDGCTITNNVAKPLRDDNSGGGGLFFNGGQLLLSNSVIKGNSAVTNSDFGSALFLKGTSTVTNCLIAENSGPNFIAQTDQSNTYQNCTFAGNFNGSAEANIYLGTGLTKISTFTNCLFYKCTTIPIGYQVTATCNPVVNNCGFSLATIPAIYANKTGCITGLTSAAFTDVSSGNWSLSLGSAAIDAGATIAANTTDITKTTIRPQGSGYDMGAYEAISTNGNIPAPAISSISPTTGGIGTTVVITGINLSGATAVSFGGTAAASFTINSANQITAVTNSASIGVVSVTTPGGTGFTSAPTITSFTPTTAGFNATVVITGTFLSGTTAVSFGGTAASSFVVNSDTQITAAVGSGTSGIVSVTTPFGTGTLAGFTWLSPTITSFTPTSGVTGTTVIIAGTNLTGATAVGFGLTAASTFTVNSDIQITAVVGPGSPGCVSVTTPSGTGYKTGFTWPAATVASFTPNSGPIGTTVTITGTNFLSASAVAFGGTAASSFVVNSATQITAVVGSGSNGVVSVTTPNGTVSSVSGFTSVPTISSLTPASAGNGTTVVITGTFLTGATAVKFGSTAATSFVVNSPTQITAVVGSGTTGSVTVTTSVGTGTKTGFIWLEAPQNISGTQYSLDLAFTSGSIVNVLSGGDLTINSDNVEVNSLTIERGGKVTLNDTKTLKVYGDLKINSDALGTGTFVDSTPNGGLTILGRAIVNQFLKGATGTSTRGWWYITTPVSGASSTAFDVGNGINKLWYYNETNLPAPAYTRINLNEVSLSPGIGYVAYNGGADATFQFSGDLLNTGNKSISVTRTGTTASKRGFNLIGNPYPSYLDWSQVDTTNVLTTIWYRSYSSTANNNAGAMVFDTYNGKLNIAINGSNSLNVLSQYIPPLQAFWVKVRSTLANTSGLTVGFTNGMRSHKSSSEAGLLRSKKVTDQKVLRLQVSNGVNSDQAVMAINNNASKGFDDYDSPKLSNDNVDIPEIYTLADDEHVAINGINSITPGDQWALGFNTGAASNNFTIKASEVSNFDADTKIVLRDNLLDTEMDLTDGTPYTFSSDVASNSTRFSIIFKSVSITTGVDKDRNDNRAITIYKNTDNKIVINHSGVIAQQGIITVCNAVGQKLVCTGTRGTSTVISGSFNPGVYMVTVQVAGKNITKKVVIN